MTGRDNVTLVARLTGVDSEERSRRVDALAELVRLDPERLDQYPDQLSGGQ